MSDFWWSVGFIFIFIFITSGGIAAILGNDKRK
ncbi:hypothetical protein M2280_005356 [Prescottella agglutinans]|uniref:Uncharacterized protein n=1 Tax=Prescottella agglutinans TaxID=1644129 RepID=A0ABT6MIG3_9NOCA|nr:hypothetical protein [Prescottella agglutinans]